VAAEVRELIGREAEQAQLAGLLKAARSGTSAALVLEGEPGVGKSALLRSVVDQAPGFRVLWSQGLQSEIELPYGGLGQLLRPIQDSTAELSPTQAGVLRTVFATTGMQMEAQDDSGGLSDRFAVAASALALLATAAEVGPILAVVDDAHWVDQPSIEALSFVANRLLAEGIVLLLSRRSGEGGDALARLPSLSIEGLDSSAATELLASAGARDLSGTRIQSLVDASNGNPLALLELPRLLARHEMLGVGTLDQPLPIGETLLREYSASFEQLSDRCRQAVLIVAILDEPDIRSVELALDAAGFELSDLGDAEDLGLVAVAPSGMSFRHPLVRSAATYSVPPSWRRRAHAAVGSALQSGTTVNGKLQRAWHLAAATVGSDENAAAQLEAAAEQVVSLSGNAAASAAYERAAQLSPAELDRHRRLVRAAELAFLAGSISKADDLLRSADALRDWDVAVALTAARVRSRVDMTQGKLGVALSGAMTAAEGAAGSHPVEAARLLIDAVAASALLGDTANARACAIRAVELSKDDPAATVHAQAALGAVLLVRGESKEGLELVLPIVASMKEMISVLPSLLLAAGRIASITAYSDHFTEADELSSAVIEKAVEVGSLTALLPALSARSYVRSMRGDWQAANAEAHRALSIARDVGEEVELGVALGDVAVIEAYYGSEIQCREKISAALEIAARIGFVPNEALVSQTLGILELSLRNLKQAVAALERSQAICHKFGLLEMGNLHWAPELSEAYARLGRNEDALSVVCELDWHAERTDRPIIKAFAARCRGFAVEQGYETHFETALRWHEESERPFELARTQLCYGDRLRRDKKRAAARPHLEQAWLTFRSLGAEIWADLARVELEAAGVSVTHDESNSQVALLTPQELQVAMAVADGASNREAAAQLFLSPKTIEYHLSRVFRKLEIASRGELGAALGAS
jgi:DNA-binding CsgD family transcriptional regulator